MEQKEVDRKIGKWATSKMRDIKDQYANYAANLGDKVCSLKSGGRIQDLLPSGLVDSYKFPLLVTVYLRFKTLLVDEVVVRSTGRSYFRHHVQEIGRYLSQVERNKDLDSSMRSI